MIVLISLGLASCSTLRPGYETPTVALSSFRSVPGENSVPAFEIGLRIINPNRETLNIEGMVYTVSLQGHEIIKGVGKDFAPIEGYSEGLVMVTAAPNFLAGIRLIGDMMQSRDPILNYDFQARLDLGGLWPALNVNESGQLNLESASNNLN